MGTAKKITVDIPHDLLEKATQRTGESITATVRRGLQLIVEGEVYAKVLELEGKVKVQRTMRSIKKDRE